MMVRNLTAEMDGASIALWFAWLADWTKTQERELAIQKEEAKAQATEHTTLVLQLQRKIAETQLKLDEQSSVLRKTLQQIRCNHEEKVKALRTDSELKFKLQDANTRITAPWNKLEEYVSGCDDPEERKVREDIGAQVEKNLKMYINGKFTSGTISLRHLRCEERKKLTALPEGLTSVKGYLDLRGCSSLTALPKGLTSVGGYLDLRCSSLTVPLTGFSAAGGGIYFTEGLTSVKGDLNLGDCSSLTALPEGLTSVGGDLNLMYCSSLTLPKGLMVKGDLRR